MFITDETKKTLKKRIDKKEPFNVNAIFKGTNGSLGYVTNKNYNLKIGYKHEYITIKGKNSEFCLYSSLDSFLRNWEILKIQRYGS